MTDGSCLRRRLLRDCGGETIVSFALVMPILLLISLGIVEFSLAILEYHRAGEATRRGARVAVISGPITDMGGFTTGTTMTCSGASGNPFCEGDPATAPDRFDAILAAMRAVKPDIGPQNIEIVYRDSGIGEASTPAGLIPLITVRVVGLEYAFMALPTIAGLPEKISLPPFTTTQLGGGTGPL